MSHCTRAYYVRRVVRASVETRGGVIISARFRLLWHATELVTSLKRCVIPSSTPDFSDADRVTLHAFVERDQHSYGCVPPLSSSCREPLTSLTPKSLARRSGHINFHQTEFLTLLYFPRGQAFIINFHSASLWIASHDRETIIMS